MSQSNIGAYMYFFKSNGGCYSPVVLIFTPMTNKLYYRYFMGELFQLQPKSPIMTRAHQACVGGAVASWLVRSSPDRAVRVRALAGDILLCSWARHLTLTVPLSTQVYKWVPANLMLGVTLRWTSIPSRGE